jgi:hypothetical protein
LIELLRSILDLRVSVIAVNNLAESFGVKEALPEIQKIEKLAYEMSAKVCTFSAPEKSDA